MYLENNIDIRSLVWFILLECGIVKERSGIEISIIEPTGQK